MEMTGKSMMKNPLYRKDMRENEKNNTNKNITMAWYAVEAYKQTGRHQVSVAVDLQLQSSVVKLIVGKFQGKGTRYLQCIPLSSTR
jgi:hypothetical protein